MRLPGDDGPLALQKVLLAGCPSVGARLEEGNRMHAIVRGVGLNPALIR
jgi:hypothetical protein